MPEIDCMRRAAIADPANPYREEPHVCFNCGAEWRPDPALICEKCNWLRCPACGGCRCSLGDYDRAWLDFVRATFCQSRELMAHLRIESLPPTENPHLRRGIALQLGFCQQWAREQGALTRLSVKATNRVAPAGQLLTTDHLR